MVHGRSSRATESNVIIANARSGELVGDVEHVRAHADQPWLVTVVVLGGDASGRVDHEQHVEVRRPGVDVTAAHGGVEGDDQHQGHHRRRAHDRAVGGAPAPAHDGEGRRGHGHHGQHRPRHQRSDGHLLNPHARATNDPAPARHTSSHHFGWSLTIVSGGLSIALRSSREMPSMMPATEVSSAVIVNDAPPVAAADAASSAYSSGLASTGAIA